MIYLVSCNHPELSNQKEETERVQNNRVDNQSGVIYVNIVPTETVRSEHLITVQVALTQIFSFAVCKIENIILRCSSLPKISKNVYLSCVSHDSQM